MDETLFVVIFKCTLQLLSLFTGPQNYIDTINRFCCQTVIALVNMHNYMKTNTLSVLYYKASV